MIMTIVEAVQSVLSRYVDFSGRSRRSEYWWFCLANLIISSVLNGLGQNIKLFSILAGLYALAVLLPSLAVGIRRLHDTGKSGWWLLIACVPIVGSILLIVWMCKDSDPGENQYGPNPKEGPVAY